MIALLISITVPLYIVNQFENGVLRPARGVVDRVLPL